MHVAASRCFIIHEPSTLAPSPLARGSVSAVHQLQPFSATSSGGRGGAAARPRSGAAASAGDTETPGGSWAVRVRPGG